MRRPPARPAPRLRGRVTSVALSLLIAVLAFAGPAARVAVAATPQQINPIDLFDGGSGGTSDITDMVTLNGLTYFAGDMGYGTELLVSDGTQAGTHMVADINPIGDSYPGGFVAMGNKVFFSATDLSGSRLYVSDGTQAGTQQVVWLGGAASNNPTHLTVIGDTLYFAADSNGENRWRLYATDGTEHGTRLVKDLGASINPSREWSWATLNGKLYFPASDGACAGLWVSDGTAEGTVELGAASGETWCSEVTHLTAVGSHLYMSSGTYMGSGEDLWISDGTTAGTFHMDLAPGFDSSLPGNFTAVGNIAYFTANDGTHGRELWRSDGTALGTYQVVDLTPAPGADSIAHNYCGFSYDCEGPITAIGDTVFFAAGDGGTYSAIYRTDGTAAGTVPVTPTSPYSYAALPIAVGSQLFYAQVQIMAGAVINVTDARGSATSTILSTTVGDAYSLPIMMTPSFNYVKFSGSHLWVSYWDNNIGVEVATINVATVPTNEADPVVTSSSWRVGSLLHADTGRWDAVGDISYGYQWYRCASESASTCTEIADAGLRDYAVRSEDEGMYLRARVTASTIAGVSRRYSAPRKIVTSTWTTLDLYPGALNGYPSGDPVQIGDTSYIALEDPVHGAELYKSDGTIAGTTLVKDICPGSCSSAPSSLTNLNGVLVFAANINDDAELWRSDGTPSGTYPISQKSDGVNVDPISLTATGTQLFFVGFDDVYGRQLWVSDGTLSGTHKAIAGADPFTFEYDSHLLATPRFADTGAAVIFDASSENGREPWVFVPATNTYVGFDIYPDGNSNPQAFTQFGNAVYFLADDPVHGRELRRIRSIETGPQLVSESLAGSDGAVADNLIRAGDLLYYNAYDSGSDSRYLVSSDGTDAGPSFVAMTGPYYSSNWVATTNHLYFRLYTGGANYDLYVSGGSAATTTRIQTSVEATLTTQGDTLFYVDVDPSYEHFLIKSTSGSAASISTILSTPNWPDGWIDEAMVLNGTLVLPAAFAATGYELRFPESSQPPVNLAAPSITYEPDPLYRADLAYGRILTADAGSWSGTPDPTLEYQWRTCTSAFAASCSDIEGATDDTYRIRQADGGKYVRVSVSASNSVGGAIAQSDALSVPYSSFTPLDLNTSTGSSNPYGFVQAGSYTYFIAHTLDSAYMEELWRSDGTDAGTVQLTTCQESGCGINTPVAMGASVYFQRCTTSIGCELWKSSGTPATTTLVKDIFPASASSNPSRLTAVGKTLYFTAYTAANGTELWASDGTTAGTALVKDIQLGDSSAPDNLTVVGNTLYFTAFTSASGRELWKSNGTAAGTVQVADSVPGTGWSSISDLVVAGTTLYYLGGDSGGRIWKSGGTAASTSEIPTNTFGASQLTTVGATLYYTFDDGAHGRELWKSDGTGIGTQMVKDLVPGATSAYPEDLTSLGSKLLFSAYDATHGRELWSSGGTAATTSRIADIRSGVNASDVSDISVLDGTGYFSANDGAHGTEIWYSDGTQEGTGLLKDINPVVGINTDWYYYGGRRVSVAGGKIWFAADDGSAGLEPWVSDGTADGTYLVKDINTNSGSSYPSQPVVLGTTTYFYANDGVHGYELWRIAKNSTPDMFDINPTGSSALPCCGPGTSVQMVVSGNRLYFVADDGVHGAEIWSIQEGSGPVRAPATGDGVESDPPYDIYNLTALNSDGTVFFDAQDEAHGSELWMSDGTTSWLVQDIEPGPGSSYPGYLAAAGDWIYFSASTSTLGTVLWRTDGSSLIPISLAAGLTYVNYPNYVVPVGNSLYFSANSPLGRELFVITEETPGSPTINLVQDLYAGPYGSNPAYLTAMGGSLYFTAETADGGRELYSTTSGGPVTLAAEPCPGLCSFDPYGLTVVHDTVDRLYFARNRQLQWIDGDSAVTHTVDGMGGIDDASLSSPANGVLSIVIGNSGDGFERYEVVGRSGYTTYLGDVSITGSALENGWESSWSTWCGDQYFEWCTKLVAAPAGYYAPGTTIAAGSELFYPAIETAPTMVVAPSLIGTFTVGSRVSFDYGEWSGVPNPQFDYVALVCSSATSIASCRTRQGTVDELSFVLANSDVGSYVRYKITASTRAGSTVAYTAAKLVPITAPTMTLAPAISGTAKVGYRLLATAGAYSGNPTPGTTFAWYRCAKAATSVSITATVAGCTLISGARSNTYTVVAADVGKFLRVRVTAASRGGTIFRWSKSAAKAIR